MSWIPVRLLFRPASLAVLGASATAFQAPDWAEGFVGSSAWLGVTEVATFDDGAGEKLYLCTSDQFQSTHPGIVRRFDGSRWEPFDVELNGRVLSSCTWDDGTGNALYLAGSFGQIAGIPAQSIARFDGTTWSALGLGIAGTVEALVAHDDGSGSALYAGGLFDHAGGNLAYYVARWDGASWIGVGTLYGHVYDLCVYDDGSGPALYATGNQLWMGGPESGSVAKWNGVTWSFLPAFSPSTTLSTALEVFDSGGGPALHTAHYVAGNIWRVGRWNGSSWTTLTGDFGARIHDLKGHGAGAGSLYALGDFQTLDWVPGRLIARWNGSSWAALPSGLSGSTCNPPGATLGVFDPVGGPPVLVFGGCFYSTGASTISNVAQWDGTRVAGIGLGQGLTGSVWSQAVFDDGTGPALYLGGSIGRAGAIEVNDVTRWNGATYTPLPAIASQSIEALTVFDDGTGPAVYAGGNGVHRWTGAAWVSMSNGLQPFEDVRSLCVWNRAGMSTLVAATFLYSSQHRVKTWDGNAWVQLGGDFNGLLRSVAVHDSGTGEELFVGGDFTQAGALGIQLVARWDGGAWVPMGSGVEDSVVAMLSYDDGSGRALYVAGDFTWADGLYSPGIARWNAGAWSQVGAGLGAGAMVWSLSPFDDGSGPTLAVGGLFHSSVSNGVAHGVARWDGGSWSALGSGLEGDGAYATLVASYRPPHAQRDALHVAGFFHRAGGEFATGFTVYGVDDGRPLCFGDGVQQACPCGNSSPVGAGAGCLHSQGRGSTLRSRGTASVSSDTFELVGADMPPSSYVSYFQGTYAMLGGIGVPFSAGLRCAAGSVIRIYSTQNANGASSVPNATLPVPISVRGQIPPGGGTRVYQAWHRDPAGMCASTSNLTNAVLVTWRY